MQPQTERLDSRTPYDYDPALKKFTVRHAATFPQEAFEFAEDIEILDMSFGHMSTLPDELPRIKNLRIAFFSHNDFEEVPEVLAECDSLAMVGFKSCKIAQIAENALPSNLRGLILTDNRLDSLPHSIGNLKELQKLMLAGNQLKDIPQDMLACQNLQLLRLPVNGLTESPDWLLELPNLAWYADSGNPFNDKLCVSNPEVKTIAWQDLIIGDKIGESAKNTVYHARLATGEDVAVKLFGGDLTTDGVPIDEINACLMAGPHPNVIGALGKITGAPDQQQGLVMPLISPEFTDVGQPPDFQTLTRDTYPEAKTYSPLFIKQVLADVASALRHLHDNGVMHGDIYAHNILANSAGARLREQVDIRGFGYLIDDLLGQCDATLHEDQTLSQLNDLRQACLQPAVEQRPLFKDVCDLLPTEVTP